MTSDVILFQQSVFARDSMANAHKHADIICKWVNGAHIQGQSPSTDEWIDVPDVTDLDNDKNYLEPSPIHPDYDWWENWRVKP